eukprot:5895474-Pyramimonas_sp.AAC.1
MISSSQIGGEGQVVEGLQQIHQGVSHIRRMLGSLEDFGESVDAVSDQITALQMDMTNMQQAIDSLVTMTVQIGTSVSAMATYMNGVIPVSYTHLRAHETGAYL